MKTLELVANLSTLSIYIFKEVYSAVYACQYPNYVAKLMRMTKNNIFIVIVFKHFKAFSFVIFLLIVHKIIETVSTLC